jgi:hypothetical protein
MARFVQADPRQLHPHPLNHVVFGDNDVDADFKDDVGANGVQTVIEVALLKETSDGMQLPQKPIILKGHRRWKAAMASGLDEVPVLMSDVRDPVEAELLLLRDNLPSLRRNLDPEMLGRMVMAIEQRLTMRGQRKGSRSGVKQEAAKEAGVDPKTARAAVAVVEKADELREDGKVEQARDLLRRAAENVQKAAQDLRRPEVIPDPEPLPANPVRFEAMRVKETESQKERRKALLQAETLMDGIGKAFARASKADGPIENPDMRQCMVHFEELKGAIAAWIRRS